MTVERGNLPNSEWCGGSRLMAGDSTYTIAPPLRREWPLTYQRLPAPRVRTSQQCVCIYTAVYSQTLTAISIFKYVNIVCIIQVHMCETARVSCASWRCNSDDRDRSVSRGDNRPYDRGLP